jgi:hypothetical protein
MKRLEAKTLKIILVVVGLVILVGIMTGFNFYWDDASDWERLYTIVFLGLGLLAIASVIILIPIIALSALPAMQSAISEDKKRPIFFQVPKNHKWIIRNVWNSNPVTLDGYVEKNEGWKYYIPTIWESDEGLVDLTPKQLDPTFYPINCKDGNDARVDVRATYYVRNEKGAAIKNIINTAGKNCDELVNQYIVAALNQAMDVNSSEAIAFGSVEKKNYGTQSTIIANEMLKNDNGKDYGLAVSIDIQNIEPTPEVKEAADRATAEKFELKSSKLEAESISTIIKETGANPTLVMIAQTISDIFRSKGKRRDK